MASVYTVIAVVCTPQQLRDGFKFIVTEDDAGHYRFYADAGERLHIHIRQKMEDAGKLGESERVIGGGWMRSESIDGTKSVLVLDAESNRFGQEPPEVREAFRPLVAAYIKKMAIEVA